MKPCCWMRHLRFLLCFSTSAFSFLYFSVRYTKTQVIPVERRSLNTVKGDNALWCNHNRRWSKLIGRCRSLNLLLVNVCRMQNIVNRFCENHRCNKQINKWDSGSISLVGYSSCFSRATWLLRTRLEKNNNWSLTIRLMKQSDMNVLSFISAVVDNGD